MSYLKEFDIHRQNATQHPIMTKYKIEAVPLADSRMDSWRDPFVGIEYKEPETGLVISGGVDDIWITPEKKLIIVDYKSTQKMVQLLSLVPGINNTPDNLVSIAGSLRKLVLA